MVIEEVLNSIEFIQIKKNNLLRFEAKIKCELIKNFQDLLITSSFEGYEFESKITYWLFRYPIELFNS